MKPEQVWKFDVDIVGIGEIFHVEMPAGAKVMDVQTQRSLLSLPRQTMWALCQPDAPKVLKPFVWVGTGHPMPDISGYEYKHVRTHQSGVGLVWHLFEIIDHD